jgi:hypothetical protein
MNPRKVVPHVEQRNRVHMVLNLLRERVRQPGKPAHLHSHGQVLPFNVTGADVLGVRRPNDSLSLGPLTLRGCPASTISFGLTTTISPYQRQLLSGP